MYDDPWTTTDDAHGVRGGVSWNQRLLAVAVGVSVLVGAIAIGAQVSRSSSGTQSNPVTRTSGVATEVDAIAPGAKPFRGSVAGANLSGLAEVRGLTVQSSGTRSSRAQTITAEASSAVGRIDLLGGRLTLENATLTARTKIEDKRAVAEFEVGKEATLTVDGKPVPISANKQVVIPDFGTVSINEQATVGYSPRGDAQTGPRARLVGALIHVRLSKQVGEYPPGTSITFGRVDASVRQGKIQRIEHPKTDPAPSAPASLSVNPGGTGRVSIQPGSPKPGEADLPRRPVGVKGTGGIQTGNLSGYLFPILGQSSYVDTWGAARASTGVPHQGTDIFAVEGTPIVAVADGVLDRVGWNSIGGYRFWLFDDYGNSFYNAHLSAFSPMARDGARVKAGDVIGFVGHTGDAQGTPSHLHFEVHPGNGAAVNPMRFLDAWRKGITIKAGDLGAILDQGGVTGKFVPEGLIFLDSADIAATSGLSESVLNQVRSTATRPISDERAPIPTDDSLRAALDGNATYTTGAQR